MPRAACMEVECVGKKSRNLPGVPPEDARRGIVAMKIVRIEGKPGGYLAGVEAGDVVFIGRGRGWILWRRPGETFFLLPENGAAPAGDGSAATVGIAGIMKKVTLGPSSKASPDSG